MLLASGELVESISFRRFKMPWKVYTKIWNTHEVWHENLKNMSLQFLITLLKYCFCQGPNAVLQRNCHAQGIQRPGFLLNLLGLEDTNNACQWCKHSWEKWVLPKIGGKPPKSSNFNMVSIINHPFWGTPIFGNTQIRPLLKMNI